ncbi:MAG: phosphoribosyltransferase [Candidatus Methanofastidiosia archaeon]
MEKVYLDWAKVDEAVWTLVDEVRKDFIPEILVGIARGGLIPAVRMSNIMDDLLMRIVDVKFYENIEKRREAPKITVPLTGDVKGMKVLIVDDVADTGKTLETVKKHVLERGALEVKIAVIAKKSRSITEPDYHIFETEKWIVFPWEKIPVTKKK